MNDPKSVQDKLNACLASDPAHITPGQTGDHVKVIQKALNTIRLRTPALGIPEIKDKEGVYDPSTTAAVRRYKEINGIKRSGQPLDPIVGRMTFTRLDDELLNRPLPPKPVIIDAPIEIATLVDDLTKDDLTLIILVWIPATSISTDTATEPMARLHSGCSSTSGTRRWGIYLTVCRW